MKILFVSGGKKHEENLREAILDYTERLSHWCDVSWILTEEPLSKIDDSDQVVLLDERGKEYSTEEMGVYLERLEVESSKRLVFVIGGAYGVSEEMKARTNKTWSLSKLTFPHMIARLLLAESVYRAYSILKGSKYHHS